MGAGAFLKEPNRDTTELTGWALGPREGSGLRGGHSPAILDRAHPPPSAFFPSTTSSNALDQTISDQQKNQTTRAKDQNRNKGRHEEEEGQGPPSSGTRLPALPTRPLPSATLTRRFCNTSPLPAPGGSKTNRGEPRPQDASEMLCRRSEAQKLKGQTDTHRQQPFWDGLGLSGTCSSATWEENPTLPQAAFLHRGAGVRRRRCARVSVGAGRRRGSAWHPQKLQPGIPWGRRIPGPRHALK